MIIPSIDLMRGSAVQLVGGEEEKIDAGDPRPIARAFSLVGEVAVIDLDAARGEGSNEAVIRELTDVADCRVGGGIRDYETAVGWLDAGAAKVVIGTAATPDLLGRLPRERVIAALDAREGEVVDQGWRRRTGASVEQRMRELSGLVGGFLVTFVEVEGSMRGLPLDRVRGLVELAGDARLTVAGGVASAEEVGEIDRLGADVQVGMALYTGRFSLADAIAATLTTDRPDGLWPTIVADESGAALGLAYSSAESLREAIETRSGVYWSRSRDEVWRKGATSGDTQELLRITPDCDRDALRFTVRQGGRGFCHTGTRSCFGDAPGLSQLEEILSERMTNAPEGSYTARLVKDPGLLAAKLQEEAGELAAAETSDEVRWEAADLLYFTLVAMQRAGVTMADVRRELERRSRRVTRRPGNAKTAASGGSS